MCEEGQLPQRVRPGYGFTAEAIGSNVRGERILLKLQFSAHLHVSAEDPREPGTAFMHGRPADFTLYAFGAMADAIAEGSVEQL